MHGQGRLGDKFSVKKHEPSLGLIVCGLDNYITIVGKFILRKMDKLAFFVMYGINDCHLIFCFLDYTNSKPMKRLLLSVFLLSAAIIQMNAANKGYIVTKDGVHLTGEIGEIFYSELLSTVIFINDFGTPYRLYPQLISGFVFKQEEGLTRYESKYKDGAWCFLKVVEKGRILSLYKTHEEKTEFADGALESFGRTYKVNEYWLQYRQERPVQISRFNFRRTMRKKLWLYPAISRKVGKPGYRFKNIQTLVQEVNQQGRRTIL